MKKTKLLALLLAALFCLGLLSACGGGSSASPASGTAGGSAADSDYAYVMGKGSMDIGYTLFKPMNYTDADGNFTGFDTELAQAVCAKLGITPNFVKINWDTKEIELAAKSIDCIWNGLTITEDRQAQMSFSLPYIQNAQVLVVRADSGITSTADLIGKTVVAEVGSIGEAAILGTNGITPDPNIAQCNYVGVAKQTDCLLEVKAGTAAAASLDLTLAKTMVGPGTDFSDLKIVDNVVLETDECGVAFRLGSDLTAKVNDILKELAADGTISGLCDKYGTTLAPELAQYAK